MAYTISYMQNGRSVGDELWSGMLAQAHELAQSAIASGEYDSVQIRDEAGKIKLQLPRVTRPIQS